MIFTTWFMHLTLCENARRFHRLSLLLQWAQWALGILAVTLSVLRSAPPRQKCRKARRHTRVVSVYGRGWGSVYMQARASAAHLW